jgi:hypothetical protein
MRINVLLSAIVLVTTASCGGTGSDGTDGAGTDSDGLGGTVSCISGLASIALSPADQTVQLDGKTAAPISFQAMGTWKTGETHAIDASMLNWKASRSDQTPPGVVAGGVFNPDPTAGGIVNITATDGCVSGAAKVNLHLNATVGTPSNPASWGGTPVVSGAVPSIVYPSDQTRFPRNLYRTLFQWYSQGFKEFRLTFTGANSKVTIYTSGANPLCAKAKPAAGCWEVDEATWKSIAGSNAGSTATWTVDALDTTTKPPTVRRSASNEIGFSKQDVKGAIFYWSTTSAGIRRGKISQPNPEDYIVGKPTPTTYANKNQVGCVACHTVSRDGKYMVAPVVAKSGEGLWVMGVTKEAPPTPLVTKIANTSGHGFATISPDDDFVVAAWKGKMWRVKRDTGAYIDALPTGKLGGTHPDWSPAGSELIFATGKDDAPGGSSLAKISYKNGGWSDAKAFLAPPSGKTNLFPMFSFDGSWIAFSQGKGGHGDVTAQLMVIPAAGGNPVECLNANRVVSNKMTTGQFENNQPTWAPPGDLNWVAFNTKREYGVVSPAGTQQIWVAAVDVDKAKNGKDPSYPAFRVPFQGLAENNHRAFWTIDITDDTTSSSSSTGSGAGGSGAGGSGAGGSGGSGAGGSGSGAGGGSGVGSTGSGVGSSGSGNSTSTGGTCTSTIHVGGVCDLFKDCCEAGSHCDVVDSPQYVCVADVPK